MKTQNKNNVYIDDIVLKPEKVYTYSDIKLLISDFANKHNLLLENTAVNAVTNKDENEVNICLHVFACA